VKNQAKNDLQLSCVRLEHLVNYVKVRFGSLGFGLLDFQQLASSSLLGVRAMSNEDDFPCLRRMVYISSRNELNCFMQTPQNTKTLPNYLVGNSRNIEGTAPTFGLFAPFDHQFVGDSLKRAYKRH
jgi:hypothetical protein